MGPNKKNTNSKYALELSKNTKYQLLEKSVLKRIAAFYCARRCLNQIPEVLYILKMVSHTQI